MGVHARQKPKETDAMIQVNMQPIHSRFHT